MSHDENHGRGVDADGARQKAEPALRAIIAYKLVRGAGALAAAGVLGTLIATGHTAPLTALGKYLRHHVTSAWSIRLADAIVRAIIPSHLWIVVAALALDGAFTFIEGWSLRRGWWWGPWLVVVAAGAFLPFEVLALAHHVSMSRVLLLGANLLVASYLARHALRKGRRARRLASDSRH